MDPPKNQKLQGPTLIVPTCPLVPSALPPPIPSPIPKQLQICQVALGQFPLLTEYTGMEFITPASSFFDFLYSAVGSQDHLRGRCVDSMSREPQGLPQRSQRKARQCVARSESLEATVREQCMRSKGGRHYAQLQWRPQDVGDARSMNICRGSHRW